MTAPVQNYSYTRRSGCAPRPADTVRGYARMNCACSASVVRAPWMADSDWRHAITEFRKRHWRKK